jgi:O-acetyl-ADP-ribose deacetylase (regulator of RNase III)
MDDRLHCGEATLDLLQGDIVTQCVDSIVNAANSSLMGGGGVDGAIHRGGGPAILAECARIRDARGPLPPGEAVITTAGELPARHVIHTVGPIWRGGDQGEDETLASAYRSSLELADLHSLTSIAFPSISTGAYGFPLERAARIAVATMVAALPSCTSIREVRLVLWSDADLAAYRHALADHR